MAEKQSLPPVTTAFMEFLHSEPFCRLLSHLTGLDLAENVIRHSPDQGGGERGGPCSLAEAESDAPMAITSCSGETKQDDIRGSVREGESRIGGEEEEKDAIGSLGETSVSTKQSFVLNGGNRLPVAPASNPNVWTESTPIDHSATSLDHLQDHSATSLDHSPDHSATSLDHSHATGQDHSATSLDHSHATIQDHSPDYMTTDAPAASPGPAPAAGSTARIDGELLYCQPGDYTLISDSDPTTGDCALDVILHFCCEGIEFNTDEYTLCLDMYIDAHDIYIPVLTF